MKIEVKKTVAAFAAVAFTLLGVLFGMQIMTFIFAQLGPANSGLSISDPGYNESLQIQNNSLQAIVTYTENSSTQFTTVGISITLVLLIAVFLLFWVIFVGKDKEGKSGSSSGGNFA